MKRMKKKVVAMVTLAMFVMTLLPMAAFAGTAHDADAQTSEFRTVDANPDVLVNDEVAVEFEVNAAGDLAEGDTVNPFPNVAVWATDEQGRVTSAMQVYAKSDVDRANNLATTAEGSGKFAALTNVADAAEYVVKFTRDGVYTLHAGAAEKFDDAKDAQLTVPEGNSTVTVDTEDITIDKIKVNGATSVTENSGMVEFGKVANGVNQVEVVATLVAKENADGNVPSAKNEVLTIENTYNNIAILDEEDNAITEVKANGKGEAKFNVRPDASVADGYYIITLKADNVSYDLTIKIGEDDQEAKTLEVVDTDAKVVANTERTLDTVAKFVAKDEKGNVVTPDLSKFDKVKVLTEPNKNKATFTVAKVNDEDAFTLVANKDMAVGDYVVRVALKDESSAVDLKFSVAKFDKAVDIQFGDITQKNHGDVTDTIVYADGRVSGSVEYVDKNGVTQKATDAVIGIDGIALFNPEVTGADFSFGTQPVDGEKDAAIGSKVTVTVYDKTVKKTISKEFTVVDKNDVDAKTLEFDSEAGKVQANNSVKVSLVDKDGKLVKKDATTNNDFGYYVASQSNEDANIHVSTDANGKLTNGEGKIKVYSDKETSAEIVVYVKIGEKVYGNTLKYTFGEEDVLADTSVVMTLGSTEMLVNNKIVDMKDAAPMATQNRTFVPFRPLGEALGAQVDYDKDAKTVTYSLGSTKIVMTLDSKTYTVNGAEKTMDVAPFAKDNRTYVPVRFVGEALGFKVTGLQDGNGKYVAVAFTK